MTSERKDLTCWSRLFHLGDISNCCEDFCVFLFFLRLKLKSAVLQLPHFILQRFLSSDSQGSHQTSLDLCELARSTENIWTPMPMGTPPPKKRKRFAPPLAGSKPSPSNPFVTCKKMTAKIWISPNLIRALSESTGVGVRGEDGVQRKGVGNLPAPQHMAMVSLKAQYSIYFMQQHCPKKHASHISKYVNPKSNFSYLLLFLCFSFHRPAPLGVIFPLCIFLNALFFSLKSRAVGMECFYLLQPPVVLLSQIN